MPPQPTKIYSENNTYQYIETLRRKREKRHKHQEFFVEGVRAINQAIAYGWTISSFIYAPEKKLSDWAQNILANSNARIHYELPPPLLEKLSDKDEPSELLAIAAMPADDLSRIPIKDDLRVLIFDRPASPGNLGSIIRSCDALCVHGLVVTGHAVDVYDPETIRASTGSLFALPVVRMPALDSLLPWFELIKRRIGWFQLVGSDEDGTHDAADHDFSTPTMLVVGNETWGMSAAYKEACDAMVRIPITGSVSSLNVAAAASILLYEMDRQRRRGA